MYYNIYPINSKHVTKYSEIIYALQLQNVYEKTGALMEDPSATEILYRANKTQR